VPRLRGALAEMQMRRACPSATTTPGVSALTDVLCDVRHCCEPCAVWVEGIAHCWLHFEIWLDRTNVPWDSPVRENFDDMQYRLDPFQQERASQLAYRRAGIYTKSMQNKPTERG